MSKQFYTLIPTINHSNVDDANITNAKKGPNATETPHNPKRNRASRDNVIYHPKEKSKSGNRKSVPVCAKWKQAPGNRPSRDLYTLIVVLQEVLQRFGKDHYSKAGKRKSNQAYSKQAPCEGTQRHVL
jgi:hypothetical protein